MTGPQPPPTAPDGSSNGSRRARLVRTLLWLLPFVILAFVLAGVAALWPDLAGVALAALVVPLALIAGLRFVHAGRFFIGFGVVLGALVIPVLALVGFDLLWAWRVHGHLRALYSVPLGALIVAIAAWVYLRPWWVREASKNAFIWALVISGVLVVGVPVAVFAFGKITGDEDSLSKQPAAAVSRLNVIVLRPGGQPPEVDETDTRGWAVQTWVGDVTGDEIQWSADGPPPFVPDGDVDTVLLLKVDGGPTSLVNADKLADAPQSDGEVQRWMSLADQVTPESTPTFALLKTSDDARRGLWTDALDGSGPKGSARTGRALAFEDVAGPRTITDLALRLAVLAPTSDQDLSLAAKHRPALFFDDHEDYPRPLNIDHVLASGKLRLCDRGQSVKALCSEVHGAADLHNGATHLAFNPEDLRDVKPKLDSTIYVHVTRSGNDHRNTVYLDYWWYFPNNPTGAVGGALCGPGFVIAGITCLDHQSDWEGVTVIVDEDSPDRPAAVAYAQHSEVVRYTWPAVQRLWDHPKRAKFRKGIDVTQRPLVFVASGTHASYPTDCASDHCRPGDIPDLPLPRGTNEQGHDGAIAWEGNRSAQCRSICLAALPTRNGGTEPARWNAFEGNWGTSDCVLKVFCSSGNAPRAPAFQDRFEEPWCVDWLFSFDGTNFRRDPGPDCTHRQPTANELRTGERLLALGDSFSSGQGAGSYEPDTNGDGNTCFRSRDAWPGLVAKRLRLVALPSLACSGAVIDHVIRSDPKRKQDERDASQLSRIDNDPGLITITIGGNDAGFADVLKECVTGDCVQAFDRPSGDVLANEAAKLARRLPAVYRAISGRAPRAKLVVVGYPRLFPEQRPRRPSPSCAAWRRIDRFEVSYLNRSTLTLNAAIAAAAAEAGADFVDVTDAFKDHELGCAPGSYLNRLQVRPRLFPASFHPNAAGHERLAQVVATALAERERVAGYARVELER